MFKANSLQKLVVKVMTTQLAAEKGNLAPLDGVLRAAVREGVLHTATAPVVVQRVGQQQRNSWLLALGMVQTPAFASLRCGDQIWQIVERSCPCECSAAACRPLLRRVFSKSNMHVVSQSQSKPL